MWSGLRIGLLGGSFNPAHDGHRHISLEALRRLNLDAVWWLLSPQNPLKPVEGMAPLEERVARARVVANHPSIVVTSLERDLATRVTAETLAKLTRRYERTRFVWLMGADNLSQIPAWQRWTRIFNSVPIAVFDRPTYSLGALSGKAAQRFARGRRPEMCARTLAGSAPPAWVFLTIRQHTASATEIRANGAAPLIAPQRRMR